MKHSDMAAALQSRIAKRAAKITETTMWKIGFHSLNRLKDFREAKKTLAVLTAEQCLDKRLLRMANEMAHYDAIMIAEYPAGYWEEY
jgi:hypothetical protein